MTTAIYHAIMQHAKDNDCLELSHQAWDNTPWIVDVRMGTPCDDTLLDLCAYCRDAFGKEAAPIHGVPGNWRRSGAIVFGETWFGFHTEEMAKQFVADHTGIASFPKDYNAEQDKP
jgi:hypothetical protein